MTEMPPVPSGESQWYYTLDNQQAGPVTLEAVVKLLQAGHLTAYSLLWRVGWPQWKPAGQVQELQAYGILPAMPNPVGGYYQPAFVGDPAEQRKIRAAKQNTITMFVVFVLCMLSFLGVGVASARGSRGEGPALSSGCIGLFAIATGIFAAIYLPLRWRVIMSLPKSFKVLGLIGGFGLIGLLLLMGVGAVIGEIL